MADWAVAVDGASVRLDGVAEEGGALAKEISVYTVSLPLGADLAGYCAVA